MGYALTTNDDGTFEITDDDGTTVATFASDDHAAAIGALVEYATTPGADDALGETPAPGVPFTALLAIEGLETADGRMFELGSLTWRDTSPVLMLMDTTGEFGHTGARFAGAFDSIYRDEIEPSRVMGSGRLVDNADGQRAAELIRGGLRGVSVDASGNEVVYDVRTVDQYGFPLDVLSRYQDARLMGASVVPFPAFEEAVIWLEGEAPPAWVAKTAGADIPTTETPDVVEVADPFEALFASAGGPVHPDRDWFYTAEADRLVGLTVTDDGHVFGHVAPFFEGLATLPPGFDVCHRGMGKGKDGYGACTTAPRSKHDYSQFHLAPVRCADGSDVYVGQITCGTEHEWDVHASLRQVQRHYSDTGTAVADVRATNGRYGVWVSGAVRPGLTNEQLREFLASKPSGDWRPVDGGSELIAVLCTNNPGFAIPPAKALVASGEVRTLIACGVAASIHAGTDVADCGCGGAHLDGQDDLAARITAIEAWQRRASLTLTTLAPTIRQAAAARVHR